MEHSGSFDKLRALIVDDEKHARENLRMLLEDFCPSVEVVGTAENITEAEEKIKSLHPDCVFLDIRMPSGAEGFDLLERTKHEDFQVVFVTAFKDFAIRAFNANAIHYILKPIDIEDLQNAVKKLEEYQRSFQEDPKNHDAYTHSIEQLIRSMKNPGVQAKLTLYHSKGFHLVDQKDITHLEAEGNCTRIYFGNGKKYLDTKTLKSFEELLDPGSFVRIHKSHMINIQYLAEYTSQDGHIAILKDGTQLPVARGRLSHFLTVIRSL